ncbi:MAG: 50S ribosomal protein L24 [Candidatus Nealsonbacteria bacterium RIFCSPLOWO2_12_FULL_39_31]|uniref:Large ribosomal subunit protein uL24 n=3 Tax=Candidatus Nealsoniibacteriota TaxID=1817911 RepID=A0A1G2EGW4_9BACT|nr:MAG: Ribosomal protein L24 [Parcubacteria group bacterium GW2011_GWA2_38_27]KKQ96725.1 MAG: Ribosomal protein L24 [Parcubacteria group bacterium GW2011_GWC2_39_11]OGZ19501.1 MAG: 50S ribosomal protein L24 [Candidatus Nealsonbacteria bacterium RIFCSPHIGHO2_01_FULL_38_55]OGZ21107.1 MAG: 50S ribosomal protein L24 [Candidatus Nealsonbacteria bacterium RIFCSPHIGHO2_02_38_10]OGZ21540.1 MAG: 50S ribosomal protein L24 [Candidatus Nealsonbacteria bacterium RIFCSPHIGHO2_02_FULL_38_75]OGZ22804.1 MAG: 
MKIHKGDTVLIISGKDRLKKGKVVRVFPKVGKIIVEAVNLRKKHVKPKRSGEKGQVAEISLPISVSSAKVVCQKCGIAVRIGYKIEGEKKYRVCKKCGGEL